MVDFNDIYRILDANGEKLVPIGESFVGVKLESFISKSVASYHLHEDVVISLTYNGVIFVLSRYREGKVKPYWRRKYSKQYLLDSVYSPMCLFCLEAYKLVNKSNPL